MEGKMILTAKETASALGIGMNKIYELLISGTIPSRRIGRKYLIPRVAREDWPTRGIEGRDKCVMPSKGATFTPYPPGNRARSTPR